MKLQLQLHKMKNQKDSATVVTKLCNKFHSDHS